MHALPAFDHTHFYGFTFVNVTTRRLTPPYSINMGAVAITTLAGARLIIAAAGCSSGRQVHGGSSYCSYLDFGDMFTKDFRHPGPECADSAKMKWRIDTIDSV